MTNLCSSIITTVCCFQLINIASCILDRPLVKQEFTSEYVKILGMLSSEIATAEVGKVIYSVVASISYFILNTS